MDGIKRIIWTMWLLIGISPMIAQEKYGATDLSHTGAHTDKTPDKWEDTVGTELPQIQTGPIKKTIKISFREGHSIIDTNYNNNGTHLNEAIHIINKVNHDSLHIISRVEFHSSTSPDGKYLDNKNLAQKRLEALEKYIRGQISLPDSIIYRYNDVIGWQQLLELVEKLQMPDKEEALAILKNTPEFIFDQHGRMIDGRKKQLMDLKGGRTWRWMKDHCFDAMRNAYVITIHSEKRIPNPPNDKRTEEVAVRDTSIHIKEVEGTIPVDRHQKGIAQCNSLLSETALPDSGRVKGYQRKPLFALKTNLLFDALLMPNVELEVPIGEHWSLMGEWMFPWWKSKDNKRALQILNGGLEGRYWLGNREKWNCLTGHFLGFYTGGGKYDLENKGKGYQGEFYIASGISYGYSMRLNKVLNMEFSLGVGYLVTKCRHYKAEENNAILVWQYDKRYKWIGPTKAKISLVWMLNRKIKKGAQK